MQQHDTESRFSHQNVSIRPSGRLSHAVRRSLAEIARRSCEVISARASEKFWACFVSKNTRFWPFTHHFHTLYFTINYNSRGP
jgi:hypothetical protein